MNTNERLDLIERVDHASEDQAKLTLKFMILKCTVKQNTIARAIRDAIERHTPTPTIVYQQPEPVDNDEAALTSSDKKSKKKKEEEDRDGGGQDEGGLPSTVSGRRQSTRRGDITADQLVGQLIMKKTKSKLKRNKKDSSDHDGEQNSPDASKKNKPKHVPEPEDETEQPAHDNSIRQPSKQKQHTVIDLVTASEDETYDNVQSENESLEDQSSDEDSPDNDSSGNNSPAEDSSDDDSSEDDSPDIVSSDDEGTSNEQQGDAIAGGSEPSQDGSNKKITQASAGDGSGDRDAAQSITISMAKTSIQNDGTKMMPFDLTKKRKAPEPTEEEAHDGDSVKAATDTQANKRPKRTEPREVQRSLNDQTCRICGVWFPSIEQLFGHRLYCKSAVVARVSHHRSEPRRACQPNKLEMSQTADTPVNHSITDKASSSAQLQVHPNDGVQAAQALSAPRLGFHNLPTNDCMDIDQSRLAPVHSDSKAKAPSFELPLRSASARTGSGPSSSSWRRQLKDKAFVEKLEDLMQLIHKCRRCGECFDINHNEAGDCQKGHPGTSA